MPATHPGPERVFLARLRRPWGRRGELIVDLHTDWPAERFAAGTPVRLVWDDGREADHVVREYRDLAQGSMLAFEGVDDIGAAQELARAWVVAEGAELASLATGDEWRHADLVGAEVRQADGTCVGRVLGIEEGAQADLLRVGLERGGDALVPLHPAICTGFDREARVVTIDPPRGLLDLAEADEARPDAAPRKKRNGQA